MLSFPKTFKIFSDLRKKFSHSDRLSEGGRDPQGSPKSNFWPCTGLPQESHHEKEKEKEDSIGRLLQLTVQAFHISGQGFFENRMDLVLIPGGGIATWDKIWISIKLNMVTPAISPLVRDRKVLIACPHPLWNFKQWANNICHMSDSV